MHYSLACSCVCVLAQMIAKNAKAWPALCFVADVMTMSLADIGTRASEALEGKDKLLPMAAFDVRRIVSALFTDSDRRDAVLDVLQKLN